MPMRALLLTIALMLIVPSAALADGGNITGTVYLDDQPGSGLCVDVFDNYGSAVASQPSGGGGDYNIYISQPGSYTVRFSDCGAGYATTQWWAYASKQEDASTVQIISDADSPGVNGYLSSAGRIAGNVKDTLGAVLTGACVRAEDQNGFTLAETTTDGNGNYALGGLVAGPAQIRFSGCTAGNYVPEYYDDAPNPSTGTPVMVATGATKSGIDAVLTPAGRISGRVQNANGEPLPSVCVSGWAGDVELAGAVTDPNGDYVIREVPPAGSYQLSAWDCYGDTYMNDVRSGQLGGVVNQVVSFTLPRPAHITGHVLDEAGAGLAAICVTATSGGDVAVAQTDQNGYYELNQLRPGSWDLSFNAELPDAEEGACSPNGDWAPATTTAVVVGDAATVTGVDKTLRHPAPDPDAGHGSDPGQPAGGGNAAPGPVVRGGDPAGSGEPIASGPSGGDVPRPLIAPATCKAPKLVGLTLAKAKKRLRAAHCTLGKVTRKRAGSRAKKRTVLAQRLKRGRIALTVAK
ncbi:MAG TPA: carboxypeptidase-like regulatory domain-containing protein [Thermoleophilaceae bacterium]